MRAQGAIVSTLTLLSLVLGAAPARAWTEANVQSVEAAVDVDASGHARVDLLLTVRIGGGWLTGLDIDGLDPDLVLVEDTPPWAISADDATKTWSPDARTDEGRIRLRFPRRGSPRRGTLRVGLAYTTELAGRGTVPIEDGRVRVSWTLPGWRAGLDNVEVKITTPEGAEVAPSMEDGTEAADEHREEERDGRTVHVFRRIHLPRTVPWTVSVDLPADALDPALRGPTVVAPPEIEAPSSDEGSHRGLAMVILVCFLSLASRASFASTCRARGLGPRPLVAGPLWLLVPIVAGLAALGLHYAEAEPIVTVASLIAIASLSIQRPPRAASTPPRPEPHLDPSALRRAKQERFGERLLGSPLLDVTTFTGLALLMATVSTALSFEAGFAALELAASGLSAVPFIAATRFHLPSSPGHRLLCLIRFAEDLTSLERVALRLEEGPRLAVVLGDVPDGLIRAEIVIADRAVLGGFEAHPVLVVETERESEAERRLADLDGATTDGHGGRLRLLEARPDVLGDIALRLTSAPRVEEAPLLAAA